MKDLGQILDEYDQRRRITNWAIGLGVGGGAIAMFVLNSMWPGPAGTATLFAGMIGAIIVSAVYWRCPACGCSLGRAYDPTFCSRCGQRLRP